MSIACTNCRRMLAACRRSAPGSARCTGRRRRPRAPRASSGAAACCRPWSSPTGSCCAASGRRARRCGSTISRTPAGCAFQRRTSLIDPCGSALDARAVVGHERSAACCRARRAPRGSRPTRPICASACDEVRGEALHEAGGEPAARRRPSESHAGTQSGRGGERRALGDDPGLELARRTSPRATASQPWSKRPLVRRIQSRGHLVRRVARAGAEVEEERLRRDPRRAGR